MAWCGVPYPRRLGGGKPRYITILEGLVASYEAKGYTVDPDSILFARCVAAAREIEASWSTSARLGHSRDPWRMSLETLERWERMLKLPRRRTDTEAVRRARLANNFSLVGLPAITSLLQAQAALTVGTRLVALEYIPIALARVTVPSASYPIGIVVPRAPWSSTVCHVLFLCQKLAGDSESSFYEAMGQLTAAVDAILPAWMGFAWYREPVSTPIAVAGGPTKAGFYLDDEHNLDNNIFDT